MSFQKKTCHFPNKNISLYRKKHNYFQKKLVIFRNKNITHSRKNIYKVIVLVTILENSHSDQILITPSSLRSVHIYIVQDDKFLIKAALTSWIYARPCLEKR